MYRLLQFEVYSSRVILNRALLSSILANSCLIEDFTCKLYSLTLIDIVEWLFGGIKPFADKDDLINLLWEILK